MIEYEDEDDVKKEFDKYFEEDINRFLVEAKGSKNTYSNKIYANIDEWLRYFLK